MGARSRAVETRSSSDFTNGLWSRNYVLKCDAGLDDHGFSVWFVNGHENRQELTAARSQDRRIGSGVLSAFEVISHGLTDQFAKIAAGVPGPVAIGGGQIGVDPDGQFLFPTRAARPLPRRSAGPCHVSLVWSLGGLLRRYRPCRFDQLGGR